MGLPNYISYSGFLRQEYFLFPVQFQSKFCELLQFDLKLASQMSHMLIVEAI